MLNKRRRGAIGEEIAVEYLEKKGYRVLELNYHYEHGEIDIIAEADDTLVFVEVKTRWTKLFGDPEDAVTPRKRKQIRKTADGYIFENNIDDKDCRFDVVAIQFEDDVPDIRHIEDAF